MSPGTLVTQGVITPMSAFNPRPGVWKEATDHLMLLFLSPLLLETDDSTVLVTIPRCVFHTL